MNLRRPASPLPAPIFLRWLLVLLAVCAGASAARADITEVDRDNGLPDAQLGAPLSGFTGLRKVEDTGRWLSFTREGDKPNFLGVEVAAVTFNFFKEKLYSINLDVTGRGNTRRMTKRLQDRYGKEQSFMTKSYPKITAQMEVREWAGKRMYCVYKSSSDYEGGVVTLLDKPTWDQLQEPRKAKEAESKALLKGSILDGNF